MTGFRICVLLSMLLGFGCANVEITKVGALDGQKGLRFYLPRPYVSVYEPFVIGSKVYLVNGTVTPDGKYIHVDPRTVKGDLGGRFKAQYPTNLVPTSAIKVLPATPTRQPDRAGPQSNVGAPAAGDDPSAASDKGDTSADTPAADQQNGQTPSTGELSGGVLNMKARNDNTAFAVTPQRRFFDIVWLPDFDEQYVIETQAGLGNAAVDITTGQGWSLQGLEASVDNSGLVKPLLKLYGDSLELLGNLAKAKIGIPPVVSGGAPQAGVPAVEQPVFEGGTPITLKMTAVRVAAPGLYPILKPKENDLNANSMLALHQSYGHRLHMPVHPFTNIAFNTYEVLVVEATRPEGDSPLNLQRYFSYEDGGAAPALPRAPKSPTPSDRCKPATIRAQMNGFLKNEKGSDGAIWVVDKATDTAGKLELVVKLQGGTAKPANIPGEAKLKELAIGRAANCYKAEQIDLKISN